MAIDVMVCPYCGGMLDESAFKDQRKVKRKHSPAFWIVIYVLVIITLTTITGILLNLMVTGL